MLYNICISKDVDLCRKETQAQVEDDETDKEDEKNLSTQVEKEETADHTKYERVYLPETDTSEDENSDEDSDLSDSFYTN